MYNDFYVEQAIHGYSNGHRLISSSCALSEKDNKKMTMLSDLSGNEFVSGFERYYTGYSLDSSRVVLACTWYAEEMKRPGCVWTHSLIINTEDLSDLESINSLIKLFVNPNMNNELEMYRHTIKVTPSESVKLDCDKLKYLMWCLWGNKKPIVIFDDSANNLEKELLFLFLTQHDLLENNFSFCTGSVSLRGYGEEVLKCQIVPRKTTRSKLFIGKKAYEAKDISMIKSYPLWVNKIYDNLLKDNLCGFKNFMSIFPTEFQNSEYVSAFVKLYVGANIDTHNSNIVKLLEMASVIFNEKKQLCDTILHLYNRRIFERWCGKEEYSNTILFFIKNVWLDRSYIDCNYWISECYNTDYFEAKILFKKIIELEEEYDIEPYLKSYANIISVDTLAEFTDMQLESCSILISINNELAKCRDVWKQKKVFQQRIISCVSNKNELLNTEIIKIVLLNSQYNLVKDLYNSFGDVCIPVFWRYLLEGNNDSKAKQIIDIVKNNMNDVVEKLISQQKNRDKLLLLIGIVDPYNKAIKQISRDDVKNIYQTLIGEMSGEEKIILAKFLLPICIVEDYIVDEKIAMFSFDVVNDLLANQLFPEDEWYKLEKILPEVAYYNNWDRCKRLRKGFKKKGYSFIKKNNKIL